MAKHVTAADAVVNESHLFRYLGRFQNKKILEAGHNTSHPGSTVEECLKKCEKQVSPIRKRACENKCVING